MRGSFFDPRRIDESLVSTQQFIDKHIIKNCIDIEEEYANSITMIEELIHAYKELQAELQAKNDLISQLEQFPQNLDSSSLLYKHVELEGQYAQKCQENSKLCDEILELELALEKVELLFKAKVRMAELPQLLSRNEELEKDNLRLETENREFDAELAREDSQIAAQVRQIEQLEQENHELRNSLSSHNIDYHLLSEIGKPFSEFLTSQFIFSTPDDEAEDPKVEKAFETVERAGRSELKYAIQRRISSFREPEKDILEDAGFEIK